MNNSITVRDAHPLTVNAPETVLTVHNAEGRHLLTIHFDGHVEGEVADASEAGRIFADALVDRLSEAGVVTTR